MYLIKNGQPCGVIGIEPSALETISFAAAELQRYLQQVTGAFIPVCTEPRNDVALRVSIDARLEDEEFEIVSKGNRVEVFGGGRLGALYGAYHLLKKYCGIIFAGFGPEGEHVPQKPTVEVPAGAERRKPLLWYRGNYFILIGEVGLKEMPSFRQGMIRRIDWMAKNGFNYVLNWPAEEGGVIRFRHFTWKNDNEFDIQIEDRPSWITTDWLRENILPEIRKRGMKVEVGAHNMSLFLPPAVYFEKHSEYFAMRDGKRSPKRVQLMVCTSNQEAVEEFTKNVLKYLEENPYIDLLSLVQEDDFGMCECEECRKLDDPKYDVPGRKVGNVFFTGRNWTYSEHQNKTRRHVKMMNYVARRIREKHPNLKINIEFYIDMSWPPADMELEDNLYPDICMFIRCAAHKYDDPSCPMNAGFYEMLKAWSKLAPGRVYLVEYYNGKSAYRSMPYPIAHRVAEDWKLLGSLGFGGQKNQSHVQNNEAYAFNNYTFARRAWDMEEPFERILDDFLTGRFGSKAEKIKPIYQEWMRRMDRLGQEGHVFNPDNEDLGYVPGDYEPPKRREGRCYHPDAAIFLAIYDTEMVNRAMEIVDKTLAEPCTFRERVQLDRFRSSLEFIERTRDVHERLMQVRKEKKIGCDRATYEKVMEFLAWEKQHIDTGYFAWGNDSYQWKNAIRGVV